MSEDSPLLVKVERLDELKEDDEVLLIHRRGPGLNYAVHGIVCGFNHEKSFLGIDKRVKFLLDTSEIEGRANSKVKVPRVDSNKPMEMYEFLREYHKDRKEAWYVFPSNGCWEAYRIDEPKPEPEPQREPINDTAM